MISISSAASLRRPRCGSGGAATLPRLCRPGPALAEPLGPDPLCLSDRHHPGAAAPAVAPHPDVHLVEPAAVAPVPLCAGRVSNTPIALEAVWDSGLTVAADEARNKGSAPQHVGHRADVEAGQARVAGRVTENGHSSSM
jgi:hypothetical protein